LQNKTHAVERSSTRVTLLAFKHLPEKSISI